MADENNFDLLNFLHSNNDADFPTVPLSNEELIQKELAEIPEAKVEEETTEEKETKVESKKEETVEDTGEFTYSEFANYLIENNVLSPIEDKLEEYEDSAEGFQALVNDTIEQKVEQRVQEWKDSLANDRAKEFLEFLESGGDVEDFIETTKQFINFEAIDTNDLNNQKQLIRDYLSLVGDETLNIEEEVENYESLGILDKESKKAFKFLKKEQDREYSEFLENQKFEKEREEVRIAEEQDKIRATIDSFDELAGFKLSKKEKEELKDYLLTPKYQDNNGRILTQHDRDRIERELSVYENAYVQMKGGYPSVVKKVTTNVSNNLDKNLKRFKDTQINNNNNRIEDAPIEETNKLPGGDLWWLNQK